MYNKSGEGSMLISREDINKYAQNEEFILNTNHAFALACCLLENDDWMI